MTATVRLQNDQHLVDMQRKKNIHKYEETKTDIFWRETDFEDIPFFSRWLNLRMYFQFGPIYKFLFYKINE